MLSFNKKVLSLAISAVVSSYCVSTYASDLEIYSNSKEGLVTLFMMLDTSGSMGYADGYDSNYDAYLDRETRDSSSQRNYVSSLVQDYNVCRWTGTPVRNSRGRVVGYSVKMDNPFLSEQKNYSIANTQKDYNVNYCSVDKNVFKKLDKKYQTRVANECEVDPSDKNKYKCYDRLTRLKIALVQVLASSAVKDTVRVGIGQFSSPKTTQKFSHDSESGRVVYPAVEMKPENRQKLIEQVLALNAFNGTPSAAAYAESGMYMLGKSPVDYNAWTRQYTVMSKSGFLYSSEESKKDLITYQAPLTEEQRNDKCNGTGIYFLTDGYANSSDASATQSLMTRALAPTSLYSSNRGLSNTGAESGDQAGWPEIGAFANLLRTQKNIKTAVVGFGSLFPNDYVEHLVDPNKDGKLSTYYDCSKLPVGDLQNTCNWGAKSHSGLSGTGGFGEGGFYSAQSVNDVMESVGKFIDDVTPVFKPMNTGSPTVPVDTFEPTKFDTSAYYSTLTPTPGNTYQMWVGNLNKYQVLNGVLSGVSGQALRNTDGSLNDQAKGYWSGGVQGKLPLRDGQTSTSNRKILTNRYISDGEVGLSYNLSQVTVPSILDAGGSFNKDPDKGYWLNLLGFKLDPNKENYNNTDLVDAPELRQLGSILHSTPILLNQKSSLDQQNKEDYLLFGTTQGLLQVVGADGKEVFSFVPAELFSKQKNVFLDKNLTSGELLYGIDATWTAYSQRKLINSNTLSVNADGATTNKNGPELLNKSLQWVYGGLRMGGKSYYSLDLTKIKTPELKFHIDPDNQRVTSFSGGLKVFSYPELAFMGQSWSKPILGWVNYNGSKRLVMFVGGGYDMGYENKAYKQENGIGAGIYMFDANSGELLWHTKNDINKQFANSANVKSTYNKDMKYSIVSNINAIDRDGDGLIDNLYFGDLAGQVFRIDINNLKSSSTYVDSNHIVRLTTLHKENGLSPRFYDAPTVTIHSTEGNIFAAISIASGNRSNPLASGNESANDGVFVIYDNDLAQTNLFAPGKQLKTRDVNLSVFNAESGVPRKSRDTYNGGWYYTFPGAAGHYKAINGVFAFGNLLRVNIFDKDGVGISKDCGAGVKGDTGLMNFCLPTGKCTSGVRYPEFIKISAGITGASPSTQFVNGQQYITTTVGDIANPDPNNLEPNKKGGGLGVKTSQGLQQLRWYEQ